MKKTLLVIAVFLLTNSSFAIADSDTSTLFLKTFEPSDDKNSSSYTNSTTHGIGEGWWLTMSSIFIVTASSKVKMVGAFSGSVTPANGDCDTNVSEVLHADTVLRIQCHTPVDGTQGLTDNLYYHYIPSGSCPSHPTTMGETDSIIITSANIDRNLSDDGCPVGSTVNYIGMKWFFRNITTSKTGSLTATYTEVRLYN